MYISDNFNKFNQFKIKKYRTKEFPLLIQYLFISEFVLSAHLF